MQMSKSSSGNAFMRVFITLLGVALILLGIGRFALGLVGERAIGVITNVRRQGGERSDPKPGRYNYSISYSFKLPDGKTVDSSTTRIGGSVYIKNPNTTTTVRYLKAYPFINSLEQDTKPNPGQLVLVAAGGFLIYVMNKRKLKV